MDLQRWTCRCGVSNVAEQLGKAQQDAADHAWNAHGIAVNEAVTFDVFTEVSQEKATKAIVEREAAELGFTAKKLAQLRAATPSVPPRVIAEPDALTAALLEITRLEQELAARQQQADRKSVAKV